MECLQLIQLSSVVLETAFIPLCRTTHFKLRPNNFSSTFPSLNYELLAMHLSGVE